MNKNKTLIPERFCSIDSNMSLDKIIQAQNNKEPIIGKVILWNSRSRHLKVDLGNGFIGFLPIEDASIYPTLLPNGNLSGELRASIGKTICVIVSTIDTLPNQNPIITLSRKEVMLNAFNIISNSIGQKIDCCVTAITSLGVFVDVGNGISGLIHYCNLCVSRLRNFSDFEIKKNSKITARIHSVNNNFQVSLDYKDLFENLASVLNPGDLVKATILEPINEEGYFAYLNPNTGALVDVPQNIPCRYGDKVIARVKNRNLSRPDKVRLAFVSFAE